MNNFESHHASDCAIHNEPALPKGKCDCGLHEIHDELVGYVHQDDCEHLAVKLLQQEIARHNARGRPAYFAQHAAAQNGQEQK